MIHSAAPLQRLGLALGGVLIAATSLATPVAAREAVDPSTLNPPPPPFANAVCGWSGAQVICSRDYRFEVRDAPTGVICDGHELFESSDRHVFGHSYYDANLNLTRRDLAERIEGILYDSVTGVSVRWTGYDQTFNRLSVPGDLGTGTGMNVGAVIHMYLDDGRSYVLFAGREWSNADTGDYLQVGSLSSFEFCAGIAANS